MENLKDYEQNPILINELTQAKELVNELRFHLSPTSSTGKVLIEKILAFHDKALLMLNWNNNNKSETETQVIATPTTVGNGMIESPQSGSPRSEDSDIRDINKKRKTMPRWTEQVRVCSGSGTEGPQEDGHSWRKYGQKDILGAKYPRGYYRCTHRHVQGCLATKQVQKSDEDPLVFDVTYRGKHTCNPSTILQAPQAFCKIDQTHNQEQLLEQKRQKQSEEMLQKIRAGLTVKTENSDARELNFSPFSFPSMMSTECIKSENNIFSPVSLENNYMGCYSPFLSPATSESNYFSPCHINNIARKQPFHPDSDLNEIISAVTSASNSPVMEFTLDSLDFDSNFPFDNHPSFFS